MPFLWEQQPWQDYTLSLCFDNSDCERHELYKLPWSHFGFYLSSGLKASAGCHIPAITHLHFYVYCFMVIKQIKYYLPGYFMLASSALGEKFGWIVEVAVTMFICAARRRYCFKPRLIYKRRLRCIPPRRSIDTWGSTTSILVAYYKIMIIAPINRLMLSGV